ncbi:MAG: FHA domain-containing protein, partial [Deltaproteobacteria bacterium]|nr:FHA domain-containing protein [Deltaproteobacteria bacterium]
MADDPHKAAEGGPAADDTDQAKLADLADGDVDLKAAADALAQDVEGEPAPAEEEPENTSIDRDMMRRVAEQYGEEKSGELPAPVADAGVEVELEEPAEVEPLPAEPSVEDLGPAFPDEPAPAEARGQDAIATGARGQGDEASRRDDSAGPPADDAPAPDEGAEDAWAGFDEGGRAWSVTGQNQVKAKPHEDSGEYARKDTGVHRAGKAPQAEPQGARLVGTAGADKGREFALDQRELSVGRAPTCGLVLVDASVSREHARLLRQGDNYMLVDTRSANGTFVNGRRVDRAKLRSGDEVTFGNAAFRFIEIGDVFKPVDASGAPVLPAATDSAWSRLRQRPYFKSLVVSAAILGLSLTTLGVVAMTRSAGSARASRDRIFEYYLKGIEAFKRRNWYEAKSQFTIVVGLDAKHERALRYIQEIARESEIEGQLKAARAARQAGDLSQAYTLAAAISDSIYTEEAQELVRGMDVELDARVARARMSLDSGNRDEALQLLDTVERVRPGRPEVLALRDRVQSATASASEASSERQRAPARATPSPPRARERDDEPAPHRPAAKRSYGGGVVGQATELFAEGALDRALAVLDGAGDDREVAVLRAKIQKFVKVYDTALEEHRA